LGFGDRLFPGVLHIERVFVALAEGRLGKLLEHVRQEAVDDGSERSIWQRRNARIFAAIKHAIESLLSAAAKAAAV
jgi:hypothetical protein